MRRLVTAVVVVLALSVMLVSVASAGKWVDNQKASLFPVAGGDSSQVLTSSPARGEVIVVDPMGSVSMVIQGKAAGLTPGASYEVWVRDLRQGGAIYSGTYLFKYDPLGYFKLTSFVADEMGNGSFHINLRAEDLNDGTYNIQVAINTNNVPNNTNTSDFGANIESTVLATPWAGTGMTVTVKTQ